MSELTISISGIRIIRLRLKILLIAKLSVILMDAYNFTLTESFIWV